MHLDRFQYNRAKVRPHRQAIPPEIQPTGAFQATAKVKVLKERAKRSVFQIFSSGEEACPAYFLKFDHPRKWTDRLKSRLRPKVKKEYELTRQLHKLGVPVVEPVCCAWAGSRGIFVSKAISDALSFGQRWLRIKDDPGARQAFLEQWRRLLTVMLQANLHHTDFHSGNILTVAHNGEFRFFLVDAVDIRICRRLSEKQTLESLKIVADWANWLTAAEIDHLLGNLPGVYRQVAPATVRQRLTRHTVGRFYRKDLRHLRRRILHRPSLVDIATDDQGTSWIHEEARLTPALVRELIARHQSGGAATEPVHGRLPDDDASRRSHVHLAVNTWTVIEYAAAPFEKGRIGKPAVVRSWLNRWGLQAAGFSVPTPLALFHPSSQGPAFIITEYVAGTPLPELLAAETEGPTNQGDGEAILQALGAHLRRLFAWKIYHPRLDVADFVIRPDGRPVMLSCDRLIFNKNLRPKHWHQYQTQIGRGLSAQWTARLEERLDGSGFSENDTDHHED